MSIQSAVSNVITRVTQHAIWVINSLVERVSALFTRTAPQSVVPRKESFDRVVLVLGPPGGLESVQKAVNCLEEQRGILAGCGVETPPPLAASPLGGVRRDLQEEGVVVYAFDPSGITAPGLIEAARLPSDQLQTVAGTAADVREKAQEEAYVTGTAQRAALAATLRMKGKEVPKEYLAGVNRSVVTSVDGEIPKLKESDSIEAARAALEAGRYMRGETKTLPKSHQSGVGKPVEPASSAKRGGWFSW